MAIKDLRILFRDKMGAFFIVVFPILMGLFFGMMMSGFSDGGRAAMKIAVVDQDQSEGSKKFVELLSSNDSIDVEADEIEAAKESVRKGNRVGLLVVPAGFGETAGVFWETPPQVELGMDPSRSAESAMLQGFVMEAIGGLAGDKMSNPAEFKSSIETARQEANDDPELGVVKRQLLNAFLNSVDSMLDSMADAQENDVAGTLGGGEGFQFANIQTLDISRQVEPGSPAAELKKLNSRWDISFPQAMMWGVLGCVAGFSISMVREKTLGTMTRLQVAPIGQWQILGGKAFACFLTVMLVVAMMTLLGVLLPGGLRPNSYPKLVLAAICLAFCFVGIMMTFSVLGKTEQSVSGVGWAINMVMAMLGGCMIPVMFMPSFIQRFSVLSPLKWGILAVEGAIWRQFTWTEMLMPCAVLIGFGLVGLVLGVTIMKRNSA